MRRRDCAGCAPCPQSTRREDPVGSEDGAAAMGQPCLFQDLHSTGGQYGETAMSPIPSSACCLIRARPCRRIRRALFEAQTSASAGIFAVLPRRTIPRQHPGGRRDAGGCPRYSVRGPWPPPGSGTRSAPSSARRLPIQPHSSSLRETRNRREARTSTRSIRLNRDHEKL